MITDVVKGEIKLKTKDLALLAEEKTGLIISSLQSIINQLE